MSSHPAGSSTRQSVPGLLALKGVRPVVCLTAYTAPVARLLDPHADLLLIGDSLGMVVYGEDSTLPVTLGDMIRHGRAVMKASSKALVAVDLPFGSYQESKAQAFRNSARVLKETGAAAIKLEGGAEMAETIAFLTARGIPVMGHIGLMPQHVHAMGGYRWQGRTAPEQERLMSDARAISEAGAFAIVLEGIDSATAGRITAGIPALTIGIGAGAACNGQILVVDDMAGLTEKTPRFVRRFAELGADLSNAAAAYAQAVREERFPAAEHGYGAPAEPTAETTESR